MASRYWGDEKHSDAVYAVYLRKVRYVPPQGYEGAPRYRAIDPDRPQEEAAEMAADHLEWESVKERVIKAGTIERLVECLVGGDDMMDSRHFNVFLRHLSRFHGSSSRPRLFTPTTAALLVQNSIRQIVTCWLETYPEDFYDPEREFAMLTNLLDFGARNKLTELRAKVRKQRERFKRILQDGGMIASLPSLGKYVASMGFDPMDYPKNIKERVKMFDVGKENCVQIAEQLTFWDAALFKELLIHQCQGCVWSKRRTAAERVYTVKATIDQFNAVSQRVMTSIVLPDCRPEYRAKNHQQPAWNLVSSRSMAQFRELSSIYEMDEDGDQGTARKILEQEGTAKSSPLRRPQLIQNCRRTKSDVNLAECQGTVPYLGNFLTDLAMIDQSTSDMTPENLINFEKRRKEFEVLAKLRLFQSAARAYNIPMDRMFCAWFFFLPCLSENECFNRSLEIEKPSIATPDLTTSRLNSSLMSNGSSGGLVKNSTLSRLFNSNRTSEDAASNNGSTNQNWHHHTNSYSSSTNSHVPTNTGSSSNISPSEVTQSDIPQMSREGEMQGEDWIDGRLNGGPPGPVPLSGTASLPRIPSTANTSNSWKGGCEFTPSTIFPHSHNRAHSGDSSMQEVHASISRNSVDTTSGTQSLSRSDTPIRNRLNDVFDSKLYIHQKKDSDASTCSSSSSLSANGLAQTQKSFYLARVGLDDELQSTDGANYKCIKIENGDRMPQLIARALEKHLIEEDRNRFLLVQLLPRGGEFVLPDNCNPFYAMAPDPTSPMLNLILRRRDSNVAISGGVSPQLGPSAKKLNRMKRTNLLRWSSGYLKTLFVRRLVCSQHVPCCNARNCTTHPSFLWLHFRGISVVVMLNGVRTAEVIMLTAPSRQIRMITPTVLQYFYSYFCCFYIVGSGHEVG
ncbi:unnamed protein product [Caenorhabditis auriculariae]|uniref:Uncharacterized protein n=1 Tax=Caenorhabditis auriculariae TaxID=2777116 RepID=A0A8S1GUL1_9PELO|nr:unnamed protein product [Caenorhabditis auriculariae]